MICGLLAESEDDTRLGSGIRACRTPLLWRGTAGAGPSQRVVKGWQTSRRATDPAGEFRESPARVPASAVQPERFRSGRQFAILLGLPTLQTGAGTTRRMSEASQPPKQSGISSRTHHGQRSEAPPHQRAGTKTAPDRLQTSKFLVTRELPTEDVRRYRSAMAGADSEKPGRSGERAQAPSTSPPDQGRIGGH